VVGEIGKESNVATVEVVAEQGKEGLAVGAPAIEVAEGVLVNEMGVQEEKETT
jgi:hypothetical protein